MSEQLRDVRSSYQAKPAGEVIHALVLVDESAQVLAADFGDVSHASDGNSNLLFRLASASL
jgi:hypothetical protein